VFSLCNESRTLITHLHTLTLNAQNIQTGITIFYLQMNKLRLRRWVGQKQQWAHAFSTASCSLSRPKPFPLSVCILPSLDSTCLLCETSSPPHHHDPMKHLCGTFSALVLWYLLWCCLKWNVMNEGVIQKWKTQVSSCSWLALWFGQIISSLQERSLPRSFLDDFCRTYSELLLHVLCVLFVFKPRCNIHAKKLLMAGIIFRFPKCLESNRWDE
jgi:hypothetical protein